MNSEKTDTQLLAEWMTANGYATGHGDDVADLIKELDWQHEERLERIERRLIAENEKLEHPEK